MKGKKLRIIFKLSANFHHTHTLYCVPPLSLHLSTANVQIKWTVFWCRNLNSYCLWNQVKFTLENEQFVVCIFFILNVYISLQLLWQKVELWLCHRRKYIFYVESVVAAHFLPPMLTFSQRARSFVRRIHPSISRRRLSHLLFLLLFSLWLSLLHGISVKRKTRNMKTKSSVNVATNL